MTAASPSQVGHEEWRRFIIELTNAGRALVREHASRHFRMLSDCFQIFSDEKETMIGLLPPRSI